MRARMALAYANITIELREILLSDRPDELYTASSKGTVPVLQLPNGSVIDESFDIWINIGKPPKYSPQERSTFGDMFANIDDNFDIWKTVENQYTRPIKSVISY